MLKSRNYYKTLWVIAKNTFYDTVRDKVIYSLIGFAVLVIAASLFAGTISLGENTRVLETFSLTAVRVLLLIITILVGTQLIFREVDQKTIFLTLTKTVTRTQFYLGKYIGICLTLASGTLIMGVIFITTLYITSHSVPLAVVWALVCLLIESWLLTALGLLFSAFSSPLASAIYVFCIALIGHSANTIWAIAQKGNNFVRYLLDGVYYIFPNLNKFDVTGEVVYNIHPMFGEIGLVLLYFIFYAGLALILGVIIFSDDEF